MGTLKLPIRAEIGEKMKYLDKDFYSVEEIEGKKVVHIHGYVYDAGEGINNPDETYRNVNFSGCYIPLDEFIGLSEDTINDFQSTCKQYVNDLTETGAKELMEIYYGTDCKEKELAYSELTLDTPCGDYVNFKAEKLVKRLHKAGDKFHISGDIYFEDYNCRVDTDGEILMDQKDGETKLLCTLDYIDGDCGVTAYVDVTDMKEVA